MDIQRHIVIQAVKTPENVLIPLWDERVSFEKTREFGNVIHVKGETHYRHFQLIECIYDLKTKKLELGVEIDIYPTETEFIIGQKVLVEQSNRKLIETEILDIVYEDFELDIKRGKKFEKWDFARTKDIKIDLNSIYSMKCWKPTYILANGKKTKWSHEIYHLIK